MKSFEPRTDALSRRTRVRRNLTHGRKTPAIDRRLRVGAEVQPKGGVHFRVWAPRHRFVTLHLARKGERFEQSKWIVELKPEKLTSGKRAERKGYFSSLVPEAEAGMLYKFRLGSGEFPDPASRFQANGPHGPSEIVDPNAFKWTDKAWKGVSREAQVIYEMHIGTFTSEGTWRAAVQRLKELAQIGITVIELMPVADFPGRFGWGYDGVNLFAPTRLYGRPEDFKAFINEAHRLGLGVILDVVYNHFGPDGNYMRNFSESYFSTRYTNEWGEAINFDQKGCDGVREFFVANARYWIDEFHLDGLRIDATQEIFDCSTENIMTAITRAVREAAPHRLTYVVAENEPQETQLVRPVSHGGHGMDALWNDDFHHTSIVACTGRAEAYYSDYKGTPQEFISALKWGYLYQGQWHRWQRKPRGTPGFDLEPSNFVTFIQNHDQIANALHSRRIHQVTSPGRFRTITALLLLGPSTPMLFQGQEFGASSPFHYFADHQPDLAKQVAQGRRQFMMQFASFRAQECEDVWFDPHAEETFLRSKLDWSEREKHAEIYALHRDLLRLRRNDPVFSKPQRGGIEGAVLGQEAFVLRFFGDSNRARPRPSSSSSERRSKDEDEHDFGEDRLVLVNLGFDLHLAPAPEPLLAPPQGCQWKMIFSTEDPCYGGNGTPVWETEGNWQLPAHSALVLAAEPIKDDQWII